MLNDESIVNNSVNSVGVAMVDRMHEEDGLEEQAGHVWGPYWGYRAPASNGQT